MKLELSDLTVVPAVRVQMQLGGGLNIQNGGVQALKDLFGEGEVMPMGANRRVRRVAAVEALVGPSDES